MSAPDGAVETAPAADGPFGTAARRAAVLAAWRSSPTRFREDANAEEDLVLAGYADRLLVELVQNAADAAVRAGEPGRLRLRLRDTPDGPALSAANTGAPLDLAGVDSLTSLRASAKRGTQDAVGRFGVGFSAVLAVSDDPQVRSRAGGIRFSAGQTREAVRDVAHLRTEIDRRGGRVPVLRLVWPVSTAPPEGFDTEVWLPLRDDAALTSVRGALAGFDAALLLGFPALTTVEVDGRVVRRSAGDGDGDGGDSADVEGGTVVRLVDGDRESRWRVRQDGGEIPAAMLSDRPVEEQLRPRWSMLAAVPVIDGRPEPLDGQVVHAPTPSDEPLSLRLRLVGSFPLDPARRRVPPGALTDWLVTRAGAVVADLITDLADTAAVLDLLPAPGFSPGQLSAALDGSVRDALREREVLPTVRGGRTRADRAVAVPDPLVEPLAEVLDGLLPAGWWSRVTGAALGNLGVRMRTVPEVVAAVSGVARTAAWWRGLYDGLANCVLEPADREALAALPVPLADGRTVTGPARVLLPGEEPLPALSGLGLLVCHPDAVHPLLERLGAVPVSPMGVLRDDRVRAAVADSLAAEDPEPVVLDVLSLVRAAGPAPGSEPWLADLALPGRPLDGTEPGWYPAGELLQPDCPLPDLLTPDAPFGVVEAELVAEYGAATLAAVGVLDTFMVLDEPAVDLVDVADLDLDGGPEWAVTLRDLADRADPFGLRVQRLRAVRDLEWVRADRWPAALELLAAGAPRVALTAPCQLVTATGELIEVPGYPAWWLARHPVLDGRLPAHCRTAGESELVGLYDPAPGDPDLAVLLGAHRGLADLLAKAGADPDLAADLLTRLGDPDRQVDAELLAVVYPRLAAATAGWQVPPPDRVRVAPARVVQAADAVVLDQPWLLDRLGPRHLVPGGGDPVEVADLLDIPLLSELPPA